jgi:hypothetical protein
MPPPERVRYAGETFYLQSNGRYYQSGRKEAPERLLHRRIWTDHSGPIPDGYDVHHRDGDWQNNGLENLELVTRQEHQAAHMRAHWQDPEYQERTKGILARAQADAQAWHSSEEGRAWHSDHGKQTWENRAPVTMVCTVCGHEFSTYFPTKARVCSKACASNMYYRKHQTASAPCAWCGQVFTFNKYRMQHCCSRACANRLRASLQPPRAPHACAWCGKAFIPKNYRQQRCCSYSCANYLRASLPPPD